MAKSYDLDIRGKLRWVHVHRLNKFGDWSVEIHPIQEDLEKIRDLQSTGLKNTLKKDEDGYYVSFKRAPKKEIVFRDGRPPKTLVFSPPEVWKADGKTPLSENIGNGSTGMIRLEVYEHGTPSGGKANAARLKAVRVDDLIVYNADRDMTPEQREQVGDLLDKPQDYF